MYGQSLAVSEILAFMKEHGERRITRDALQYYKDWRLNNLCVHMKRDGLLAGMSLCGFDAENEVLYSVTVVHLNYRNQGIGTDVLSHKVMLLREQGIHYQALVAEDNIPSNRICEKTELVRTGVIERVRSSGPFIANLYRDVPRYTLVPRVP